MADNNLSIFNSTLPTTTTEIITDYDTSTTTASLLPSYINVTITNGGQLNGVYDAWCVNSTIAIRKGTYNQANVYSSYGTVPAGILYTGSQTINSSADEYLNKLKQINWLINNVTEAANVVDKKYRYNNVDYTWGDVQLAIWKLLGETSVLDSVDYNSLEVYSQQRADALVSFAVTNGSNFIPVAGQDFGVIVKGANLQPILMEVKTAGLGDFVWHDLNANGVQEANEGGIDGVTVTLLDGNGNVVGATTTGDNPYTTQIEKGWYQFGPLLPSTYQVKFSLPAGFNTVSPYLQGNTSLDSNANTNNNLTSAPITLVGGEVNRTIDAGFYKTASLGDFVFNDTNNNSIQDATEAGVAGVTVQLINPVDGSVIATTTTDANGGYSFSSLKPGDYQVKFTSPAGYIFSEANIGDDAKDSDANSTTGLTETVTLTSGEFNGTIDAGLVRLASLGNFVFEDKNANGIQDASETGIANATVNLLDTAGNVIATTTTDANGLYSFSNLQPGDYKVEFVQPDGFNSVSVANIGANDEIDSDGLITDVVNLSPGENDTTVDSGFYKTASLGDFVFNDANNNGIQDATETGIAGVKVQLINPVNGIVIATTSTDVNGGYTFNNLKPGDYQVKFTSPAGYIFSEANIGDDTKDSDANSTTGLTETVTLTSGEFNGTLDAGLVQLASLGNFVFEDKNANGIQEAGEAGIANATVKLLDAAGSVIATTTTDENGLYSFSNLQPGDYKVQFVQPDGFNGVSVANIGTNDEIDSDGLITDVVNLSPGENDTTVDSGFYKTASLGDFVFNDANNNGIQDATEVGVNGVTVQLINPVDGTVIGTTTTDANGAYNFNGLTPGDYQVKFTSPTGYIFSQANIGDDAKDSDANSTTGLTETVTLTSGEFNGTLDAGLVQLASLGNFVFEDKNANGIQEAGEAGIANATVKLLDAAGSVIATTTTDENGLYSFSNLQPGDYKVQFVQPDGFNGVSVANIGTNDEIDSDGLITDVVNLSPGENDTTVDSGFYKTASLGDFVFNDANNNGIQDATEVGVNGVTVQLINPVDGTVIGTTTTDANGAYNFNGLTPGDYQVKFTSPTGYIFSQANIGDDAKDSDANSTTGLTETVTLTSGEFNGTLDAGLVQLASLGDKVWLDNNANGIQDAGEAGVGGVTVTLTSGGADGIINGVGDTTVTATTNANGNYSFTGLTPSQQYQVGFSNLPTGYEFTKSDVGANDAVDSDVNPSTGKTQIVTLAPGENNLTLDAGIYQNAGDLSITKTNGLTTVTPGQQITYTIVAKNNGLITATNALVSDIMPTNLTNVTWSSVASDGATENETSGTGSINDYVTLAGGSSITYTVNATVAANAISSSYTTPTTISLTGGSSSDGAVGNIRTFSANGVSVKASAFSSDSAGTWNAAKLGLYGSWGLGVIDYTENSASHRVDNSGLNNYVLLEFSESVVIDKAALAYVAGADSDISVWVGNFNNPFSNHIILNNSVLNSFSFTEVNNGGSTDRTADINAGNIAGNAVVIAAKIGDTNDSFKLKSLDILKATTQTSGLSNTATITGSTGFTDTNTSNNSATDTDTVVAVSTVKVGDRVWYDADGDGVQDTGESGVSGVAVKLFNSSGAQIGTTTTDANGLYQFSVNANSSYSIQFAQPTGFDGFTTANVGIDAADSDVINSNGTTAQFSVGTTDNLTIDAGLIKNIGDLSITKSNGLTSVAPGQKITYTIVATNNGLMTATNALVSDIMPTNLTDVTWTSVATEGAKDNQASGTGSINDYVTLAGGSSITYTVNGTVSSNPVSTGAKTTFDFGGNSSNALDGPDGNTRTFTKDGVTVTARAFSRVDGTNGAWGNAYLGSYSGGGLGVTDSAEGDGRATHRVDNVGGRDNYVLFQFSESVVLDRAYLQYVINDSDISVWIGNSTTPVTTLNDSILNSFGFNEVNETTLTTDRWADVNAGNYVGNTIVIAASAVDATPEDQFKIRYLDVLKPTPASLANTATITGPTGFTDTNTSNNSATDTDTILAAPTLPSAPGVRTPGFWQNSEWQKFWDGIQGNEPSQKTESNFADSDLLFAPYTNSAQPGKVLDPVTGQYETGLLVGDFNRNGRSDAGEDTLFYSRAQALQMVDASQHPNGDKRYDLGRSLIAGWLNYLAGNPIDTVSTTDKDARYYIKEGINWLQAVTPDENGDKKGDGALNNMIGSNVNSARVDNLWSLGISSASSLPSPYNSNTNVLYGLDAGSVINDNLDKYNNGLGLADNVYHG